MIVLTLSTGHKLGLGLIALAFIVFALVASMVIPRRNPGFPGRNLSGFVMTAAVLFAATLFAVFYFGRESKGEIGTKEAVATETTPSETAPTPQSGETPSAPTETETQPTETQPNETQPAETATTGTETNTGGGADLAAGKQVFADAGCGGCHTLADAGASGSVGPNLDDVKPSESKVESQVRDGGSVMPAFKDRLSDEQIKAVAAYVSSVAGKS